jgi:hypothetical protein
MQQCEIQARDGGHGDQFEERGLFIAGREPRLQLLVDAESGGRVGRWTPVNNGTGRANDHEPCRSRLADSFHERQHLKSKHPTPKHTPL